MRHSRAAAAALASALTVSLVFLALAPGQQVHRNGFESRTTSWVKGTADMAYQLASHDVSEQEAHTGELSEHLRFSAEQGSYLHYLYPVGRAPVSEELNVSVWIKANRPGMQ